MGQERRAPDTDPPDEAIVRRVVRGDVDAYEEIVRRHTSRVRRVVARNVPAFAVAEVAQDAFVSAYLSLPSYEPTAPFERWLVRIALRSCADHWRACGGPPCREARGREARDEDIAAEPPRGDDRELLEWALAQLDDGDRAVVTLVYFEGATVRECADALSWGTSKVKVRAHRARARLREILRSVLPEREGRP